MNILFLTLSSINDINTRGIYTDLLREFSNHGHHIYVVTPCERREQQPTRVITQNNVTILKVKTFNIKKTNVIEKGIGTIAIEYQYIAAIKKYFSDIKVDLVLYSTPPITFTKVIERVKKQYAAKSYLLLKDIFPQNAVDLGMFSSQSLIYRFFRWKERKLYNLSDYIGCMSPANVEYVLKHNPEIEPCKVEVCPNSIALSISEKANRENVLSQIGIPSDKIIFIYGGNLGKPQGIDFLLKALNGNRQRNELHFLIVGSGTEYGKLAKWYETEKPQNVTLKSILPKDIYDKLVAVCDVGMIFLDHRFTIPNYPSRLLSYLENKMPVLCVTDKNSDVGSIAVENQYGFWVESGDIDGLNNTITELISNKNNLKQMGENGYQYLCNYYTVNDSYKIIMKHFNDHV